MVKSNKVIPSPITAKVQAVDVKPGMVQNHSGYTVVSNEPFVRQLIVDFQPDATPIIRHYPLRKITFSNRKSATVNFARYFHIRFTPVQLDILKTPKRVLSTLKIELQNGEVYTDVEKVGVRWYWGTIKGQRLQKFDLLDVVRIGDSKKA